MKKKLLFTATILSAFFLISLCTHQDAGAAIELMDGKLILNGFLKENWYVRTSMRDREKRDHDTAVDYARTSALIEALYTVKESPDLTIRLFGGVRWWWEKSLAIDDNLNRKIPHRLRKDYKHPRDFEDFVTEAYIDIIKGPWEVRIGKQIVIWGQLDMSRVADVVNPLDLRWNAPGIDNWEEIKQGLWMIRALYQSQLPGDLLFEVIFNPGDFKAFKLPYQGTHWGASPYFKNAQFRYGREMGMYAWLQEKVYRDAPTWDLSENYEFGFRIRGFTWDTDWTLLYWNALADGHTCADPNTVTPLALQYVKAGLRSMMRGGSVNPGDWPSNRVFQFKRYTTIGGTAQREIGWFFNQVFRWEWFLEINSPLAMGTRGADSAIYGSKRRDIFGIAMCYVGRWDIPWFTRSRICNSKKFDITITYFWEKVFNHNHDLVLDNRYHQPGDSVADSVTLFFMQQMFNASWAFVFIGNYIITTDGWMAVPNIAYIFPEGRFNLGGLRAELGYKAYGRRSHKVIKTGYDHMDSIILRLRYEF